MSGVRACAYGACGARLRCIAYSCEVEDCVVLFAIPCARVVMVVDKRTHAASFWLAMRRGSLEVWAPWLAPEAAGCGWVGRGCVRGSGGPAKSRAGAAPDGGWPATRGLNR